MSVRTRRRLVGALVTIALTLPAESILLKAVSTASPQQMAQQWAGSLSSGDLSSAASLIQAYPFAYRRAIMTQLTPAQRSAVWQNHIAMYLQSHPGLDDATVASLESAIALASPAAFTTPTDDVRAAIGAIAAQVTSTLGASEAQYLFYRLGPPDGTFASAEPISLRLVNLTRRYFTARADGNDCNCEVSWGCSGLGMTCSGGTGCNVQTSWPACGWLWDDPCDGMCAAGFGGS